MDRGLKVPLSPNEEVTLRRVAHGTAHRETLRSADVTRLESLGLIGDSNGVLSLTPMGQQRLADLTSGTPDKVADDPRVAGLTKAHGADRH